MAPALSRLLLRRPDAAWFQRASVLQLTVRFTAGARPTRRSSSGRRTRTPRRRVTRSTGNRRATGSATEQNARAAPAAQMRSAQPRLPPRAPRVGLCWGAAGPPAATGGRAGSQQFASCAVATLAFHSGDSRVLCGPCVPLAFTSQFEFFSDRIDHLYSLKPYAYP